MCSTNIPAIPSPHDVTQEDVVPPLQRLEMEKITGDQSVRGGGRFVVEVMYETH